MSDFKRLAHALWQCKYHIVWCPKYRFRILKGSVQKSVNEIITQLCEWKKLEILEMNVMGDHVHLIISIPPKFAVADIVGYLKGKCAIKIFDKHLELKKRYWGRHFWAKGYCVSTIGLDEEKIRKYVKWQLAKDIRTNAGFIIHYEEMIKLSPLQADLTICLNTSNRRIKSIHSTMK